MKERVDKLGVYLILLGVFAWAPYFTFIAIGDTQPVLPFLTIHLTGIIPGTLLKQRHRIYRLIRWVKA